MIYLVLLILFGLLFLVVEIVFLPGVSVGALLSVLCYGGALFFAFRDYGFATGGVVLAVIVLLSLIAVAVSLRAKTWERFSLKQSLHSSSKSAVPSDELEIGAYGITLSRLSPMGSVEIQGRIYEAKSMEGYVDPRTKVEVVGFENFSVIVRIVK